jgi:GNAT superfamily N-acetyltransferase
VNSGKVSAQPAAGDSTVPSDSLFHIRAARKGDAASILVLIKELAAYEKLAHEVIATEQDIDKQLFGTHPHAEALVAEYAGKPVGFALFFHNFSTFLGRPGLYLEDLYVKPEFRGRGFGKKLLAHLAKLALQRGCGRFEWAVLDWNTPAIRFYESLGAKIVDEWKINRMTGEALRKLAQNAESH